jgi:cytochrome c peroxidase
VACHNAPHFTNFRFHNTGATQEEYDRVHGAGAFARLEIPSLETRNAAPDQYLPATALHPNARGQFLEVPHRDRPGHTDLGLWNIFANPDYARSQTALRTLWESRKPLPDSELLPRTIALFKVPSLRGLALSDPYLHTGDKKTLEEVIEFYRRMSRLAVAGRLRNPDPALLGMRLSEEDVAPLAAFLRSLNEDYE